METNKDITRENIINAASIAFSKYGFKKATLDDITSFTNVSKTGIYYYFKSKEEVFNEVIKKEAAKMQEFLNEAINQENTPIDKVFAYVYGRMSFLEKISYYYSALKNDLFEQLGAIYNNREEFDKIEIKALVGILDEGVNKGDFFIDDTYETAITIMLTLKGLEIPFFGTDKPIDYKKHLDRLTTLLLYGITPR
ncbi:MAG TPA: TetR/AcrR family transcriptional regulator [Bacteroidales bacterium]|nr:TetR/AcrR family transcriptional regulator [Bacteroidales bacterium]